jgi:KUP system potassium uptake protein
VGARADGGARDDGHGHRVAGGDLGAFSVTLQAIQLGFLPRLRVRHTSAHEIGQIYVPAVNWALLAACVLLVVSFRSSGALAAAYGIAVTGTMVITSTDLRRGRARAVEVAAVARGAARGLFLRFELSFLGANLLKLFDGGWLPLLVGGVMFTLMTTWKRGRGLVYRRTSAVADRLPVVIERVREGVRAGELARVRGTAVFLSGTPGGAPAALLHNIKHNRVAHEQTVLATVQTAQTPSVPLDQRVRIEALGDGFYRAEVRFGYMEDPHLAPALECEPVRESMRAQAPGLEVPPGGATYFTNRDRVWATPEPGMALWREHLFAGMSRTAASAADYFGLPPARTVEIGNVVPI